MEAGSPAEGHRVFGGDCGRRGAATIMHRVSGIGYGSRDLDGFHRGRVDDGWLWDYGD